MNGLKIPKHLVAYLIGVGAVLGIAAFVIAVKLGELLWRWTR